MAQKIKINAADYKPELLLEWSEKNARKLNEFSRGSEYEGIWICKNGHEWKSSINYRANNHTKCPYCNNIKVNENNSLATKHPELLAEWDYEANIILPEEIKYNSSSYVFWKCNEGHKWKCKVYRRTKEGRGCNICASKYGKSGKLFLDHASKEIVDEWHYEFNSHIDISKIKLCSRMKVWWKNKKCGHEWDATLNDRCSKNLSCPYCSSQRTDVNKSLAVIYPELILQWDFSKNELTPWEVLPKSNKRVHWVCQFGHKWESIIESRIHNNKPTSCPECNLSTDERKVNNLLRKILPNEEIIVNKYYHNLRFTKTNMPMQLDFFVPKLNFAIEVQGSQHFGQKFQESFENILARDLDKIEICKNNNIHLLHITYREMSDILAVEAKICVFLIENVPESLNKLNLLR